MDLILPIVDHSVIIAPAYLHEYFLRERANQPFVEFKLFSKEDFFRYAFFDFDERAVIFLMKKENTSYENAKIYLSNLYFLPKEKSEDVYIKKLQEIKDNLQKADLLLFDTYFLKSLSKQKIIVFGYPTNDHELLSVLKDLKVDFEIVPIDFERKPLEVAHFETIEEELRFVFNEIGRLISGGVSIDNIFFYSPPSEYDYLLRKMARFYGIPLNIRGKNQLLSTRLGIEYLSNLKTIGNPLDALYLLKKYSEDDFFPLLENIVMRYKNVDLSKAALYDFFKNALKSTLLPCDAYIHAVRVTESFFYNNSAHIFIIGFNEGNFPKSTKDIDFLNDKRKILLGRLTSNEMNEINEKNLIDFMFSPANIHLTYKDKSLSETYYKSPLIERLKIVVIPSATSNIDYGNQWANIRLAQFFDTKKHFHEIHPEMVTFEKQIHIPYRSYNHDFKYTDAFKNDSPIKYSYSSIKTFYQCQFKYFMENVLYLDPFEDNFYTKFGKLAHTVLERKYNGNFDFDNVFEEEKSKIDFNARETAILLRLKEDLRNVVKFNQDHENHMFFAGILCEYRPSFMLTNYAKLNGSIDKVVITGNSNQQYISLIDYKTGNEEFNSSLLKFGYSLQLPIYALLASNDSKLKNKEIIGLYIQKIIPNKLVRPSGKDSEKFYYDQLKLGGLSIDNTEKLKTFDSDYASSKFIKTIRVTKDNAFYKTAKVAPQSFFEQLKEDAKTKVLEADVLIRQNDFRINPKKIDNQDTPCKYCSFRDVCFRSDEDIISLRSKEASDNGELD